MALIKIGENEYLPPFTIDTCEENWTCVSAEWDGNDCEVDE